MKLKMFCLAAGFAAMVCLGEAARADVSLLDFGVGGHAAAGANYVTFDDLPVNGSGTFVEPNTTNTDAVTVTLTPDAQVAFGSVDSQYAAPFLSGNNNLF